MQRILRSKNSFMLKFILLILLFLGMINYSASAASESYEGRKAIVLVLDEVSLEEILDSRTPNIDYLLENGAVGLMNTRARSSQSNKGSRYLSLGMGVRTLASTQGGLAFGRQEMNPILDHELAPEDISTEDIYKLYTGERTPEGEIINLAIGDIKRAAYDITPNNEVGLLGKKAREEGISIGVLGNSDLNKPSREISMLAMDEKGAVPYGAVGNDLLRADDGVIGGVRLDEKKLLSEFDRINSKTDILFVEYGDTARIQKTDRLATDSIRESQKKDAIERADAFLGDIMERVDMENTMFMVISPNPSRKVIAQGNFGLTPVIVSAPDMDRGLLTSRTTRREGLVTNFDFGPTLLNFFSEDRIGKEFIGEAMESIEDDSAIEKLLSSQSQFLYLRKFRSVFHWSFIALVAIVLLGFFIPVFTKWKSLPKKYLNHLGMTAIGTPITMMLVSLFGYKSIVLDLIFVFGGAFLIGYLLNLVFKSSLKTMSILGLITSLFLLVDIFLIEKLMIISPLGSDAIAGGRFYGIGNDYMGILLGSTILGLFILFQNKSIDKRIMAVITTTYLFVVIVALSPFFGANMGGTLSAMLITLLAVLRVLDIEVSWKKLVLIGISVVGAILLIAALDISFNPNPTHAGKALSSLMTGGVDALIEILRSKLGQVFWNIAHASWNVILFSELILTALVYRFKKEDIGKLSEKYPNMMKGLGLILFGGLVIFLFNDTGTIAAALIYIYLWVPLGLLLNAME